MEFACGIEAGVDISGRLLEQRHDTLILAIGARNKRDLSIPGRTLSGIHFATDYLTFQNRLTGGEIVALPPVYSAADKRVVVIGGGDTGSDCVGTARRQGAVSVHQLEIMPQPAQGRAADNPWPQWPRVLRTSSSHEEGCERRWNVTATSFAPGVSSAVGAVHCTEVTWASGHPVHKENSAFTLEADMVLLAMGFTGAQSGPLLESLGMAPDAAGRLPRTDGRLERRVYVCGDAATGPSLVVRAIHDGLQVAENVIADCGL